ncbi:hypothetical protein KUCAC02_004247 [Chaenocephalus aceratus]|uniref:Uncharacterized protein n=1 Tax=Chaenocephalus aceratus TaxID=36190 RepID=A0ACB9WXZ8_CHAAC|nr:hypothetical protein KUCAC02_004247 [Chaenocephalus aceratus]
MDLKDRRNRSLTRGRCSKDSQYNTSSLDTDECRVPTQKSYSSSETLKAFDHEQRLHYGGCVTDLVHHEADEYSRQGPDSLVSSGQVVGVAAGLDTYRNEEKAFVRTLLERGAMAPVAQAGAERTDVIWGLWEVYDHDAPIWEYLLGRYCAANGVSVGHECVYARDGDGFMIINT